MMQFTYKRLSYNQFFPPNILNIVLLNDKSLYLPPFLKIVLKKDLFTHTHTHTYHMCAWCQ